MKQFMHRFGKYFLLHFALVLYSFTSVLSKCAGKTSFFSTPFFLCYGSGLGLLFVYAILWQQVLKKMSLSTAFAHKAVVMIWGMVWGVLFFQESIRWNMVLGVCCIIVGIVLVGGEEQNG